MFCRSPNSISIITSFFLVRGLKGTFTFSFDNNSSNEAIQLPCVAPTSSFLSNIGEETLRRLHEGKFQSSTSDRGEKDRVLSAAVDRQLEYLHCLLMNLHCPAVKNILLVVQDDVSNEFLVELLSHHSLHQTKNSFADKREKLIPINFSSMKSTSQRPEKFQELDQPIYSDFFSVAQQFLHPTRDVAAICNSDIHFNTKQFVEEADVNKWFRKNKNSKTETVMALTRYEEDVSSFHPQETMQQKADSKQQQTENATSSRVVTPKNVQVAPLIDDYRGSHDAFLFRPVVLDSNFIDDVKHPQNAYQSENIVIDAFAKLRDRRNNDFVVDLRNPCKSGGFRIAHKHESEVRQWYPPLNDGRYGKVVPE